jgi:hypothetical protein
MADHADNADDFIEQQKQMQLAKINTAPEFPPIGICYNCDAPVGPEMRYCDKDCAEDHAHFIKRKRQS